MNDETRFPFADFSDGDFYAIPGMPHPTHCSVMLMVACRGTDMRPLGTCFAVSNDGLVLTARHVVEEAGISDGWGLGALYVAPPEDQNHPTDLLGGVLPANRAHISDSLDIAAVHLNIPVNAVTGMPLKMPAHALSCRIPEKGEHCFAIGYHNMEMSKPVDGVDWSIAQAYSASRGVIQEVHYPQRDSFNLPFPCFETSARYDAGMSGGPVIDMRGKIVGVVCSSLGNPDNQGYISYASLVGPALLLQVLALIDGKTTPAFLYDFVIGGSVFVDDIATVNAVRGADELTLDFGRPPRMRNVLSD